MTSIKIAGKHIGRNHPPFIIAEMSGNHNQSLDRALELVDAAALAGAHALKIQTFTADTMTLDINEGEFIISNKNSPWNGRSLYSLYDEAHTPWDWHKPIFDRAKKLGLIAFSAPFDETAVDFLEELEVPCYKIASFENIDLPLIKKVAQTGKPLIISTGMANICELNDAVNTAQNAGCKDLILLKCTSSYPAPSKDSNLATIPHMRNLFNCEVGLSDHTLGIGTAIASIVLGSSIIEKHFTLSREEGGIDSSFSLEPKELKSLVEETKRAWLSVGSVCYGTKTEDIDAKRFRRSLYIVKDLKPGDLLNKENLKSIRPGLGLSPKFYDSMIGKSAINSIKRGTPCEWSLFH